MSAPQPPQESKMTVIYGIAEGETPRQLGHKACTVSDCDQEASLYLVVRGSAGKAIHYVCPNHVDELERSLWATKACPS